LQEYAEHKLLALDKDGKGLVIDSFRFPSCCTCNVITGLEL
jgi:Spaetzle